MTFPIYAVGDVHGQKAELDRVLHLIDSDGGTDAGIVFLGDYTDRGPDSRSVIDTLIDGRDAGRNWTFLKGNHDRMFQWFMANPPRHDPYLLVELYWLHERLGGDTTLASYGIEVRGSRREKDIWADAQDIVPKSHIAFLRDLQLTHTAGDYLFVHAGIRPNVPLNQQTEEDLLWIRQEFHNYRRPHPKVIVHGHTPVDAARHYGNRINLDAGAGYGAPLVAAVFDGDQVWELTDKGRVSLTP
jgi:calcineurin-like phosphoesterase family protein